MNIAYLVLAHDAPDHLLRLIDRLAAPGARFHLHLDAKMDRRARDRVAGALAGRSDVSLLEKRERVHWGTLSVVRATLRLLDAALDGGVPFDAAVLLSGRHYPLRPPRDIAARLARDAGKIFLDHTAVPDRRRWPTLNGGLARFEHWTFFLGRLRFPLPFRRRIVNDLTPWGGSQWWILPPDAARRARDAARAPEILRYFAHVRVPDEHLFHTLLLNDPALAARVVNDDLTEERWAPGARHPRALGEADFDGLAASGALFARKFDPATSGALLDRIDRELLR